MRPDDELERRVRERTAHLEAANQGLEAFASAVSHELRAPARSILGFTRLVLEEHGASLPADAAASLRRVETSAAQLSGMLDGLLRLARTGQRELLKSTIDLGRIAGDVVERLRCQEPERDVECVIQAPLIAIGDEVLLGIVLENLLGNAWKFTRATARGRIELTGAAREGRSVYCVRDNGAGFESGQARRLFEPFQRLHRSDEFPGIGIGLATVKRIVALHGGKVWADGRVGAGATFCFTL